MADSKSNTMELNSILEEARGRKSGSRQNNAANRSSSQRRNASSRPAAQNRPSEQRRQRSFEDDFVLTDDSYTEIAPTPRPASRPAGQSAPAAKKKKKSKTGLIVTLCIVGVLLLAAIGGLTLYLTSGSGTGPESTFSDNVIVNGKSLAGMTMDQARTVMASVEKDLADGIKVAVKAGDKTYNYTKDDFKYSFNTEQVLAEAKAYSEEKGIKTSEQSYEIKMTVDDSTCADIITAIAKDVHSDAKDAAVVGFDPSADSMFSFSEETDGVALNEKDSLSVFSAFIKGGSISGTVDAVVETVKPEFTKEYLKNNIVELSHFSTVSTNNANGNENMRVSLAACNGSIIEPGATWSFNDCTGNSNLESNGYKPAGVIIQGRSETGVGGGICQSSTTIYNAGILCGMDVVERQCHYYKSVYVDAGRDATVDYGNIDLKLSNPFKYQLFMKCWMDGTELNCTIYGLQSKNFDDIEITTTSPSYFDRGYKVYTTRHYYLDGEEVDSDDLPSSTYYTSAPSSGGSSNSDSGSSDSGSSDSSSSSDDDSGSSSPEPEAPASSPETPEPEAPAQEPEAPAEGGEGGE